MITSECGRTRSGRADERAGEWLTRRRGGGEQAGGRASERAQKQASRRAGSREGRRDAARVSVQLRRAPFGASLSSPVALWLAGTVAGSYRRRALVPSGPPCGYSSEKTRIGAFFRPKKAECRAVLFQARRELQVARPVVKAIKKGSFGRV